MDYQVLFNVAMLIAGFFGGWTLTRIYSAIDRLDQDVRDMPHTYVAKEDYREDIKDIKEMLGAIFKRLENKVDK
jgi:cell fate (sporulation/competence/biofilm development) regulator YmcA (YheA/YmcA/DUF963 family)